MFLVGNVDVLLCNHYVKSTVQRGFNVVVYQYTNSRHYNLNYIHIVVHFENEGDRLTCSHTHFRTPSALIQGQYFMSSQCMYNQCAIQSGKLNTKLLNDDFKHWKITVYYLRANPPAWSRVGIL